MDEEYSSYSTPGTYIHKCKQLNILPIFARFEYHDLNFFHSVYYKLSCVKLPEYLEPFTGSRLRSSHLDRLCLVSKIVPKNFLSVNSSQVSSEPSNRGFAGTFFYRAHLAWNKLPFELREINSPANFRVKLIQHLWHNIIGANAELECPLDWDHCIWNSVLWWLLQWFVCFLLHII